jgi:hypothetical protein
VASKFGSNNNLLWRVITGLFKALFAINVKKGAKTSIHLACSDDVKDISGRFFSNCEVKKGSGKAKNEEHNEKLWEISEDAVSPFL